MTLTASIEFTSEFECNLSLLWSAIWVDNDWADVVAICYSNGIAKLLIIRECQAMEYWFGSTEETNLDIFGTNGIQVKRAMRKVAEKAEMRREAQA